MRCILTFARNAPELNRSLVNLTAAHDKLRAQIESNVSENKELVDKIMEVERLRLQHQKQMHGLESELQQVRDGKTKEITALQNQVSDDKKKLEAFSEELARKSEVVRDLQERCDVALTGMKAASEEKNSMAAEASQLRSSLNDFAHAHEKLKDDMEQLQRELELETPPEESRESRTGPARSGIVKDESGRTLRVARPTDIHEENFLPVPPPDSPYLQMISYTHTQEHVKALTSTLRDRLATRDLQLSSLKTQLEEAQAAHQEQLKMTRYLTIQLEEARTADIEVNAHAKDMEKELRSAEVKLAESETMIETLKAAFEQHTEEQKRAQLEVQAGMDKGKKEAAEYATHLEKELETARGSIMEAAKELEGREEEVRALSAERDGLVADLALARLSSEDLTHAHSLLKQTVAQNEAELAGLLLSSSSRLDVSEAGKDENDPGQPNIPERPPVFVKKEKTKVLRSARPSLASGARNLPAEITIAEKLSQEGSITFLVQEQLKNKDHEICTLSEQLRHLEKELEDTKIIADASRRECSDYATHLEEQVEVSKASIAEAVESMRALEESNASKDDEVVAAKLELRDRVKRLEDLEVIYKNQEAKIFEITKQLDHSTMILNKSQKEAEEYAAHLEQEVEVSKVRSCFFDVFLTYLTLQCRQVGIDRACESNVGETSC